MTKWTDEKLRLLSQAELHNLHRNAQSLNSQEAQALIRQIESLDVPYTDPTGFKLDSPAGRRLQEVVFSVEGKAAGVEAADKGLPALAGIEPLLRRALGHGYERAYEATVQAGYVVANMMEQNGFKKTGGKGAMPSDSIAKTAELFVRQS